MPRLLEVENLKTYFKVDHGIVKAVDGATYHINEKEIVAIVGESGCGKSVTQLSVMQLIPTPPGEIIDGKIIFEGQNLLEYDAGSPEMRAIRGAKISMIFQEPMTSLNPVLTIGRQITESIELHLGISKDDARKRAGELLSLVGIPDGIKRLDEYPYQFSGGMRQRVMIAIGLACNPRILIADEPTTALDVTTQAQLLELLKDMVDKFDISLIIVTHNLGIVARYADRLYVMYAGRVVESGTSKEIFGDPRHPYTKALLKCVPRLDEEEGTELVPIEGAPPNLANMTEACAFQPRCPYYGEKCIKGVWPVLRHIAGEHYVSCYVEI